MSQQPFLVGGIPVAMPPPEGYVVNFAHPQRQYDVAAYITTGIFNFLVFLFAGQRLWTRHFIQRKFDWEDVCFILAWMFSTVIQILICRNFAEKLLGTHTWELPLTEFMRFVKEALYILPIMYTPVSLFAKMTLLLFYSKLSPQTWFRWAVWAASFIIVGSNVAIMFATIFPCKPMAAAWDITILKPECIKREAVFQSTAILGVVTDIVLLAIPVPMVIGLRMPLAQKIGLIGIFAIGSITIVTSIIRLIILMQQLTELDQSWGTAGPAYWIIIESNLCIMCAALPTLRVFATTTMPAWFGERSGVSGSASGGAKAGFASEATGGPPTIGGTGGQRQRQKYSRFDDDAEYGLETFVKPGSATGRPDGHRDGFGAGAGGGNWDGEDGESEKGILQTRTTIVEYKQGSRPPGSKPPVNLGLPPV